MRDPQATRARILHAALAEFCLHGLSGARVDRIAESGAVNKRMIYHYFGDKAGLFDAALGSCLGPGDRQRAFTRNAAIAAKTPMTDQAIWMLFWAHLERPEALRTQPLSQAAQALPLDYEQACIRIAQVLIPGLAFSAADLATQVQVVDRSAGQEVKPRIKLKPRLQAARERKT
jgi:AcrR family transcriptional regulator